MRKLILISVSSLSCLLAQGAALAAAPLETRPANNSAFTPAFPAQTRAPAVKTGTPLQVQPIAEGLTRPWAFEILPDGRFLVTERAGTFRIVDTAGKLSGPIGGIPEVMAQGQGGLLDVALDPGFAANRTIYWSYSEPRDGGSGTSLAKGVLTEDARGARIENVRVIFRQVPTFQTPAHFGSRIVFTPDGRHLYLTLGERASPDARVQSQDLGSHLGKVVRLDPDGAAARGNPFISREGAKPEIWSYGHRNVQAATLDAQGRLWTIEHGPLGGDELNRPEAGRNYGWPVIGYGIDYSGSAMHTASQAQGMEQPVYYWDPVIAPSSVLFHSGRGIPEWRGNVFAGGMSSMKLVRLVLEGDQVVGEEWLLQDRPSRIRDLKEAPDGSLIVLTEAPAGALLKISPAG